MYEPRSQPPLAPRAFTFRLLRHFAVVGLIILLALSLGVAGYMGLAHQRWDDAVLNASMILGGMGPVDPLPSTPAKLFASAYALFSGVVFIAATGILLAPPAHHILHRFHWESDNPSEDS